MDMKLINIFKGIPSFAGMAGLITKQEDAKAHDLNITQARTCLSHHYRILAGLGWFRALLFFAVQMYKYRDED